MRDILFLLCVMLTICAGVFCLLKLIAADIRTAKETFQKFPEWKRQTIAICKIGRSGNMNQAIIAEIMRSGEPDSILDFQILARESANGRKSSVMLNSFRANRCFVRTSESWYTHETSKTKTVLQVQQLPGRNAVSRAMVLQQLFPEKAVMLHLW